MSTATVRTVLRLSLVTGTSMLAMDLYLPAVPVLQAELSIGVAAAQATVAIFLAGLAASQLLWGEALNRLGPRRCLQWGVSALVLASAMCALAPGIETLLVMRLVQGIAAGAATVIAPSVVRATLSDADLVKGIAAISMVEAIVPAAWPVLGALLLQLIDWRGLFWIVAGIALAAWLRPDLDQQRAHHARDGARRRSQGRGREPRHRPERGDEMDQLPGASERDGQGRRARLPRPCRRQTIGNRRLSSR